VLPANACTSCERRGAPYRAARRRARRKRIFIHLGECGSAAGRISAETVMRPRNAAAAHALPPNASTMYREHRDERCRFGGAGRREDRPGRCSCRLFRFAGDVDSTFKRWPGLYYRRGSLWPRRVARRPQNSRAISSIRTYQEMLREVPPRGDLRELGSIGCGRPGADELGHPCRRRDTDERKRYSGPCSPAFALS